MVSVGDWLAQTTSSLLAVNISTARLDAQVLLEDATNIDRTQLLAYPEKILSSQQLNVLNDWLQRRMQHEPLAYIRGKSEFYGREFVVGPGVLVPRPESETIIDLLLNMVANYSPSHCKTGTSVSHRLTGNSAIDHSFQEMWTQYSDQPLRIADVGTGSGALGITASLELQNVAVELLEIDEQALEIAKMNVIKHTTDAQLIKSDLLLETVDYQVLLCNLPYIPDNFNINKAATFEPKIALFAGTDGLDLYRRLFEQLADPPFKPLLILTEAFPDQHLALQHLAATVGYEQLARDAFIQAFYLT